MATQKDVVVCWAGRNIELSISDEESIQDLKQRLEQETGVLAKRQKLMGLKFQGKPAEDESLRLFALQLPKNNKIMMVGSREEHITTSITSEASVVDDFDFDYIPDSQDVRTNEAHLKRLQQRIQNTEITLINPLRPDKKLCVLDLDYTLFDMKSAAPTMTALKRPYLDEFLTAIYDKYEIVIWSQTSWRWLELKLTELGLLTHQNFKIAFVLDRTSMFEVTAIRNGEPKVHEVKALEIIWSKFPQFGPRNSVHVDDLSRNFAMNPANGLKISPYKNYETAQHTDRELVTLTRYLIRISDFPDFTQLDFSKWKKE
eukprot:c4058_g1_i1.p1 GENE.c4058_g1_i1~~c4058_g1_i1.p1  ORF type:complete len:325 (+),score=66.53 c4058_g1_i1:33-977(+)